MKKPAMSNFSLKSVADDFRNLNPKDVGVWPAVPRAVALTAIFAAILAAGWWFIWSPQVDDLEAKAKEEVRLREDWVGKKKQAVNLDLFQAQKAEIDRVFGALLKLLPNKTEIEALLVEINQSGLGRGLQFELFKPGSESRKDFYAELPIQVKLVGSYHDIGAFASDIGRLSRIVTLNNVSLTPGAAGMTLDATTMTFRALDQEELATQKKPSKGGKNP
jgi:type IV pilus assembly protein PilO